MEQQIERNGGSRSIAPVLFLIFNRPETTKRVFEEIRKAKPSKIYVVADGPRNGNDKDKVRCEEARNVISKIDWNCEVKTLFRETNLGCGPGIASAISWFFEHESEGIILEDDCLPSQTFFRFCSELLEKYRFDTRVMEIGGNNYEKPYQREAEFSYSFSAITYIWGWATWKRAWKYYDFEMKSFKEIQKKSYLKHYYDTICEKEFFQYIFEKMYQGDEQTNRKTIWDYQWQFTCHINSGLVIVPNRNLVKNIGMGVDATNTTSLTGVGHDVDLEAIYFPLKHPEFIMVNRNRDLRNFKTMHTSVLSRTKSYVKQIIPKPVLEKWVKPVRNLFKEGLKVAPVKN
jgi:hypothetical protein